MSKTIKLTEFELNNVIKKIIQEMKDFSAEEQKNWSKEKERMYDIFVNHENTLSELKHDLERAKGRKDTDDIKYIKKRIYLVTQAKKAAEEEFNKL